MDRSARIYVAGHRGLVGSAIVRRLRAEGCNELILKTRTELDLTRQERVASFFASARPDYVFLAAAKVGGILANDTYPADFIRDNLLIEANVIDAAHREGVQKILFFGSSCIYPKHAPQPIREEYLLTGPLEPTNEPYAIAKIAGIRMAQAYRRQFGLDAISLMPTNLYGPGDSFDLETAHVLPALVRKFHEGKVARHPTVVVWGTGAPRREFLHVDDLADAAVFLMDRLHGGDIVNVGVGEDLSIRELAAMIARVVGYDGEIVFDTSKPDGTPLKRLDLSRIRALGWKARIPLEEGIRALYEWFLQHGAQR